MSIWDRIRSRVHTPYVETTYKDYPAYTKTVLRKRVMWIEKEDGLHRYQNEKPYHPFGGRPMVFEKCSWKWLSRLSQIKADMDGFWRHNKWWDREAKNYIYGREVSDKAVGYLAQVGSVCDF